MHENVLVTGRREISADDEVRHWLTQVLRALGGTLRMPDSMLKESAPAGHFVLAAMPAALAVQLTFVEAVPAMDPVTGEPVSPRLETESARGSFAPAEPPRRGKAPKAKPPVPPKPKVGRFSDVR